MARISTLARRVPAKSRLFSRSAVVSIVFLVGLTFALYNPDDRPLRPTTHSVQRSAEGALEGRVTYVRDDNTIEVAGTPVRIANLDCVEMDTESGRAARDRLLELVRGETVTCELEGRMVSGRDVGTCALARTGKDVGELVIAAGACG